MTLVKALFFHTIVWQSFVLDVTGKLQGKINTVKSVLRSHFWDKEKVDLIDR
jgi:hypothetical protein